MLSKGAYLERYNPALSDNHPNSRLCVAQQIGRRDWGMIRKRYMRWIAEWHPPGTKPLQPRSNPSHKAAASS